MLIEYLSDAAMVRNISLKSFFFVSPDFKSLGIFDINIICLIFVITIQAQFIGEYFAFAHINQMLKVNGIYNLVTKYKDKNIIFPENHMPLCAQDQHTSAKIKKKQKTGPWAKNYQIGYEAHDVSWKDALKLKLKLSKAFRICTYVAGPEKDFELNNCLIQKIKGFEHCNNTLFDGMQHSKNHHVYMRSYALNTLGSKKFFINDDIVEINMHIRDRKEVTALALQSKEWGPLNALYPRYACIGAYLSININHRQITLAIFQHINNSVDMIGQEYDLYNSTKISKYFNIFHDQELFWLSDKSYYSIDRLAWLPRGNLAALSQDDHRFFFLHIDEFNKLQICEQHFGNESIYDIAVDAARPYQLILLSETGKLLYINLSTTTLSFVNGKRDICIPPKKTFKVLTELKNIKNIKKIWFYNNKIGIQHHLPDDNITQLHVLELCHLYSLLDLKTVKTRSYPTACLENALQFSTIN